MLLFSGNLSFVYYKDKNVDIFKVIESLVKKGISIKALCRVDFAGSENIEKLLNLNLKYGKELIEIRHREHPLRVTIVDNKFFNLKEIQKPTGREYELKDKVFLFYTIYDEKSTEWITKIFWKMFNSSIRAEKRIEELHKLKIKKSKL
jgi:hypothetical protein